MLPPTRCGAVQPASVDTAAYEPRRKAVLREEKKKSNKKKEKDNSVIFRPRVRVSLCAVLARNETGSRETRHNVRIIHIFFFGWHSRPVSLWHFPSKRAFQQHLYTDDYYCFCPSPQTCEWALLCVIVVVLFRNKSTRTVYTEEAVGTGHVDDVIVRRGFQPLASAATGLVLLLLCRYYYSVVPL